MKLMLLDKKPSSARLGIEELIKQFNEHTINWKPINAESEEGIAISQLYDCVDFPTILITRDDGQLIRLWQGGLPTIDDILQNYGVEST